MGEGNFEVSVGRETCIKRNVLSRIRDAFSHNVIRDSSDQPPSPHPELDLLDFNLWGYLISEGGVAKNMKEISRKLRG